MIHVLQEGAGWTVTRDGRIVTEDVLGSGVPSSGVHKTKGSAYRYARMIALTDETIEVDGGVEDIDD